MKPLRAVLLPVVLTAGALTTSSALASVVVGNLGEAGGAYGIISPLGGSSEGSAYGQAFSTPTTGPGWSLNSLTFTLDGVGTPPGDLTVQLYSDASGTPGTLLVDLSGPNPSAGGNYSYTPDSSYILAANTTYFALLTGPTSPGNFYGWLHTTTGESGDPGWAIADVSRRNPSGAIWLDATPLRIEVNATAIPEPSTALVAIAGFAGAYYMRRRRRSV